MTKTKPGMFRSWGEAAPFIALVIAFWVVLIIAITGFTRPLHAQTATAGAVAGSASKSASLAASQGNSITYNSNGGDVRYKGSYDLRTVPSVQPPGFSSGHPCAYAPVSLGAGWVGAGASIGGQIIDDACLLAQMGYTREAMAMIAARNKSARSALQATGNVAATPSASSASTKSAPKAASLYSKCALEGGKIKIRYTATGRSNKAAAQANCKRALGY